MKKLGICFLMAIMVFSLISCGVKPTAGRSDLNSAIGGEEDLNAPSHGNDVESGASDERKLIDWGTFAFYVSGDWRENGEFNLQKDNLSLSGMIRPDKNAVMETQNAFVEIMKRGLVEGRGAIIKDQRSVTCHNIQYEMFDFQLPDDQISGEIYMTVSNGNIIALGFQTKGELTSEQQGQIDEILQTVVFRDQEQGEPEDENEEIPENFQKVDWGVVSFYRPNDWNDTGYYTIDANYAGMMLNLMGIGDGEQQKEEIYLDFKNGIMQDEDYIITNETKVTYHGVEYYVINSIFKNRSIGITYFTVVDHVIMGFIFVQEGDLGLKLGPQAEAIMKTVQIDRGQLEEVAASGGLMTKAAFDQIEIGMTYGEVVKITASSGALLSETDSGRGPVDAIRVYVWYGDDMENTSCNITFQRGKVIGKVQFDLE